MTGPDVKAPDAHPILTTHPLLGVAGVLLGAMIATCTGRLMSVGLADIRGALHLGVDEASWINTSFNASHDVYWAVFCIPGRTSRPSPRTSGLRMDLYRGEFSDSLLPFAQPGHRAAHHRWA